MANASLEETYRALPTQDTFREAGGLTIKDENGKDHAFKSLYTNSISKRHLIVFIRHFFCGACELYEQKLSKALTLPALASASTEVTIIGCGGPSLIPDYRNRNGIPSHIRMFTDPSRELYKKLGMPETTAYFSEGWKARNSPHHDKGFFSVVASSMYNMISSGPSKAVQAGPPGQNGGVVLIEDGDVKFCHRMRHTGDYLDPKEAKEILGIAD